MYVPLHFRFSEHADIVAFMRRFNFATIVTQVKGLPFATHLPFVIEETAAGEVRLLAHFAKANPQWKTLEEQTALVIFSEPHAYISPLLYEKEQNVPTWNYVAVHVYGKANLITKPESAFELLEKQMQTFEGEYLAQWERLSQDYKNAMVKGIAAIEMTVEKLEAKSKLSQNKTVQERENIIMHLAQSSDTTAREIGEMMKSRRTLSTSPNFPDQTNL